VRTDIRTILAASDIFTLPTYYREGIPRVLLEASSMGVPSITTDMPGCSDVIEDGVNGLVIEPRSAEALANAITRLIEDPALRRHLSGLARVRALEAFDLAKISQQTRTVYSDLLANKLGIRTPQPEAPAAAADANVGEQESDEPAMMEAVV
jgi:glycosyltransferase involved in cell wall biosynthesis